MAFTEQDSLLEYLADNYPHATVILLSNIDEDELYCSKMIDQASRLNMGGFLHKPIEIDSVKSILEGFTKKKRNTVKKSPPPGDAYNEHYCCTYT
jgi:hypothetical protein